jgi:hypothetical protein
MRYARLAITVLLVAIPSTLVAQLSEDVYRERIRTAQATPTTDNLLQAAEAARLLRDYRSSGKSDPPRAGIRGRREWCPTGLAASSPSTPPRATGSRRLGKRLPGPARRW